MWIAKINVIKLNQFFAVLPYQAHRSKHRHQSQSYSLSEGRISFYNETSVCLTFKLSDGLPFLMQNTNTFNNKQKCLKQHFGQRLNYAFLNATSSKKVLKMSKLDSGKSISLLKCTYYFLLSVNKNQWYAGLVKELGSRIVAARL